MATNNFAYVGDNNNHTGFTNNWLESRKNTHFFEQNYNDFALYDEHRGGANVYSGVINNSYRDVLKTVTERDTVSDMYFSQRNIQHLKKLICDTITKQSGGKYRLTPEAQSDSALLEVMSDVYQGNAKHLPDKFSEQVSELNYQIVLYMVPKVMNAVQLNLAYQRDHSQQPLFLDRPQNLSSAGTKSNKSVTSRFI